MLHYFPDFGGADGPERPRSSIWLRMLTAIRVSTPVGVRAQGVADDPRNRAIEGLVILEALPAGPRLS